MLSHVYTSSLKKKNHFLVVETKQSTAVRICKHMCTHMRVSTWSGTSWPWNRAGNNYSFKWTCQALSTDRPVPLPCTHTHFRQKTHTHTSCCSVGEIHQQPSRQIDSILLLCSELVLTVRLSCCSVHTYTHSHKLLFPEIILLSVPNPSNCCPNLTDTQLFANTRHIAPHSRKISEVNFIIRNRNTHPYA